MEFLKEKFNTHGDFSYSLLVVYYSSSYLLLISQNVTYLTEYKKVVLKIPLLAFNISKQQQFCISMIFSKLRMGCAKQENNALVSVLRRWEDVLSLLNRGTQRGRIKLPLIREGNVPSGL